MTATLDDLYPPPPPPPPPAAPRRRSLLGARTATALLAAGLLGGGLAGGYIVSNAATTSSPSVSASPSAGGSSSSPSTTAPGSSSGSGSGSMAHGCALPNSGTVTAVGASTVTIDGKVYAVTSSSDIDKSGESSLSKLAVGDKVTFSTVAGASTPTIDRLHTGDESLNRPAGGPHDGPPPSTSTTPSS